MTTPAPVATERRYRFSVVRTLFCGVLLSILAAACLYLYHTAFPFYHERLIEVEKKTTAWFVEQLGFSLPFILICLFHAIVYHKHDRRDGVAQREMMWEVIVVAILIYGILLPYLNHVSRDMYAAAVEAGADIPETEGGVPWTLMMKLQDWFIRLSIPLALLTVFHAMRARREREHPETEAEERYLTVDEYNARRMAESAAETVTVPTADAVGDAPAQPMVKSNGGSV